MLLGIKEKTKNLQNTQATKEVSADQKVTEFHEESHSVHQTQAPIGVVTDFSHLLRAKEGKVCFSRLD